MAYTQAQFDQLLQLIESVQRRQALYEGLQVDVQTYIDGGDLSDRLQDMLRSWLPGQMQTRLANYKTAIDDDVVQIQTHITNYVLPIGGE